MASRQAAVTSRALDRVGAVGLEPTPSCLRDRHAADTPYPRFVFPPPDRIQGTRPMRRVRHSLEDGYFQAYLSAVLAPVRPGAEPIGPKGFEPLTVTV